MNFIEELKWRGLVQDIIPGTEDQLEKEMTTGYVGFDPTSDSLHIGSLVPIILLMHLQKAGHKPVALVGGATGMVGDPSGKSEERNMLSAEIIDFNVKGIQKQLSHFLNFDAADANGAILVNNYDWFKDFTFLDFIRDVGKYITVNYMLSKDSVQKRLETGMSFTEFTYQLVQGYDFYYMHKHHGVKLQMGGSDQWGNIVTGNELIRKKDGGEAFAFTAPLLKKADGGKFGKTESGNVWLDASKTSPYRFYQFWLNVSDSDAVNYFKVFTFIPVDEIESLIQEHQKDPGLRLLQKRLSQEVTTMVHSDEAYQNAVQASQILFSGTTEVFQSLDEATLLDIMDGVKTFSFSLSSIQEGVNIVSFLSETGIFPSKGEAKKMVANGGVSINKSKVPDTEFNVTSSNLLNKKYMLVQKGKKEYHLVIAE
ncbi:MAG TPA: tyrosine--tRNA ligase [Chitinophagaceae bacterium]|nr:tyrosine--tRNA ligase [Chitinophagaceae bacterium]